MSEHISNRDKRQQVLKKLIRQLHEGKTVEEVKEEFAALLRDVSPMEVAKIEQALIDEGMPETEVKRLCDVHVEVFRESLEAQAKPDTVPGHPIYTFLAENGAAGRVLDELLRALEALRVAALNVSSEEAEVLSKSTTLESMEAHLISLTMSWG